MKTALRIRRHPGQAAVHPDGRGALFAAPPILGATVSLRGEARTTETTADHHG